MAFNVLPRPANGLYLAPVEHRQAPLFCFALLTVSCALASFALACATPFAAFAVIAAAMLSLRPALLVVMGAWLVNQAIGFGALHYPVDTNTMLWVSRSAPPRSPQRLCRRSCCAPRGNTARRSRWLWR